MRSWYTNFPLLFLQFPEVPLNDLGLPLWLRFWDITRKHNVAELLPLQQIPKKAKYLIAMVDQIAAENGIGGFSKYLALMTREGLKGAQHDPETLLIVEERSWVCEDTLTA